MCCKTRRSYPTLHLRETFSSALGTNEYLLSLDTYTVIVPSAKPTKEIFKYLFWKDTSMLV